MIQVKNKIGLLYLIAIIGLFYLMAIFLLSCKTLKKENYVGKVSFELITNHVKEDLFSNNFDDGLLFGNYLFEKSRRLEFHQPNTIDKDGNITPIKEQESQTIVLDRYILTNLKTGTCIEFDTTSNKPKIIGRYKSGIKPNGLRIGNPDYISYSKIDETKLIPKGDTTVEGKKYSLLIDTCYVKDNELKIPKLSSKLYLNAALKNFPIHLSKSFDIKHNSFLTRMDFLCKAKNGQIIPVSLIYDFKEGLSTEEISLVKKYIKLSEADNKTQ